MCAVRPLGERERVGESVSPPVKRSGAAPVALSCRLFKSVHQTPFFPRSAREALKSMDPADTQYLKRNVGDALAKGMAQIVLLQPSDPVQALGAWLVHHADFIDAQVHARAHCIALADTGTGPNREKCSISTRHWASFTFHSSSTNVQPRNANVRYIFHREFL